MKPTIGILPCRSLSDYVESVRRAGGEPRVLDIARESPAQVIGQVHGLLFTGGGDVDPARYGEAPSPSVKGLDPARDEFEFALIGLAAEAGLPVLAICRGMQVLNVARGGTLVQDIPTEMPGSLDHAVSPPLCAVAHDVWATKNGTLWALMRDVLPDADSCAVNSRHHQSIKRLAPGLEVTATAPDGVIEAVEDPSARFVLAVQWHPENFWRTGEFRPLFEGFVRASAEEGLRA
ncbi:MAG: gamma-glutamyl-gamma-aminobutyrate hydrolase family protein [Vicinamibacterales bacterium]